MYRTLTMGAVLALGLLLLGTNPAEAASRKAQSTNGGKSQSVFRGKARPVIAHARGVKVSPGKSRPVTVVDKTGPGRTLTTSPRKPTVTAAASSVTTVPLSPVLQTPNIPQIDLQLAFQSPAAALGDCGSFLGDLLGCLLDGLADGVHAAADYVRKHLLPPDIFMPASSSVNGPIKQAGAAVQNSLAQ